MHGDCLKQLASKWKQRVLEVWFHLQRSYAYSIYEYGVDGNMDVGTN